MSLEKCSICGKKAFMRCEEHNRCDDCGMTRKECDEKGINLIHRCEGLICSPCWKERMDKAIKEFDGDTEYTSEIVCPYCGYKFGDSYEYHENNGDEIECHDCENKFTLNIHFSVDYSTSKLEEKE